MMSSGGGRCGLLVGLLGALWLLAGARAGAEVFYVTPRGNDTNAGTSWATAKATVQGAMNLAYIGDEIWVAAGLYANSQIAVNLDVSLYGGFNGTETRLSQRDYVHNPTVLDGGGGAYVVSCPNFARLDGFTVRNATNDIEVDLAANGGGGIIANNTITGATTGIYGETGPSAPVEITNNVVSGNQIGMNVASGPVTIIGNTISRNYSTGLITGDVGLIARNIISQNGNGGIIVDGGVITIEDNLIADNVASQGAGIFLDSVNATIVNNTLVGNQAYLPGWGGGIFFYSAGSLPAILANDIIVFNSSGIDGTVVSPTLATNDVYGNFFDNYDGLSPGATDMSADPLFVDLINYDYHLTSVSPCIEMGTDSFVNLGDTDLDGNPRSNGGYVDIGAYEWVPSTFPDLADLAVSPDTVFAGQTATGQVVLTGPAPAPGVTIALTSSLPGVATVPSSVVVPTGASAGFFTVTAGQTASPTTIFASYRGITQSATFTVIPLLASFALSQPAVAGAGTVNGTITFNVPAPAGTSLTLSSSDPSVTVPSPLNVPTGAASVNFTATTSVVNATIVVTLGVSYSGQTLSASFIEDPPATLKTLTVAPTTVTGGFDVTGVVTLTAAAPAGGIEIPISSSAPLIAGTPADVTVPAGKRSVSFPIGTATVAAKSNVTLSATIGAVTKTAVLTVAPNTIASLTLLPATVEGGTENSIGIITLALPATVPLKVTLGSKSANIANPDITTLTIPVGATEAVFNISTSTVTKSTTATITATLFGFTTSKPLTVTP